MRTQLWCLLFDLCIFAFWNFCIFALLMKWSLQFVKNRGLQKAAANICKYSISPWTKNMQFVKQGFQKADISFASLVISNLKEISFVWFSSSNFPILLLKLALPGILTNRRINLITENMSKSTYCWNSKSSQDWEILYTLPPNIKFPRASLRG